MYTCIYIFIHTHIRTDRIVSQTFEIIFSLRSAHMLRYTHTLRHAELNLCLKRCIYKKQAVPRAWYFNHYPWQTLWAGMEKKSIPHLQSCQTASLLCTFKWTDEWKIKENSIQLFACAMLRVQQQRMKMKWCNTLQKLLLAFKECRVYCTFILQVVHRWHRTLMALVICPPSVVLMSGSKMKIPLRIWQRCLYGSLVHTDNKQLFRSPAAGEVQHHQPGVSRSDAVESTWWLFIW